MLATTIRFGLVLSALSHPRALPMRSLPAESSHPSQMQGLRQVGCISSPFSPHDLRHYLVEQAAIRSSSYAFPPSCGIPTLYEKARRNADRSCKPFHLVGEISAGNTRRLDAASRKPANTRKQPDLDDIPTMT